MHSIRDTLVSTLSILGCSLALLAPATAQTQAKIHPGPIPGEKLVVDNARGMVWCEIIPITGTPPNLIAQIYNSTGLDNCTEERAAAVDVSKLAAELKVPQVVVNPGRYWVLDRVSVFKAGETVELGAVKVKWAAEMTLDAAKAQGEGPPYVASKITRDTEWLYKKDRPVWLLKAPDKKVWVMQVFTKAKDPTLSLDTLDTLPAKLQLPEGWKFEKKVLNKDLSLLTSRVGGVAHIMRDNLGNTYMGCGFDKVCNYVP